MTNRLKFPRILNLLLLFTFLTINYSLDAQVFRTVKDDDEGGTGSGPCFDGDNIQLTYSFLLKDLSAPDIEGCDLFFGVTDSHGYIKDLLSFEEAKSKTKPVDLGFGKYVYEGSHTTDPFYFALYASQACLRNPESNEAYVSFDLNLYCRNEDGSFTEFDLCEEDDFVDSYIYQENDFDCSEQESIDVKVCCPENIDTNGKRKESSVESFTDVKISYQNDLLNVHTGISNAVDIKVHIFDINGKRVYAQSLTSKGEIIRINNLSLNNGAYIISLQSKSDNISLKYFHMR